LQAQLQRSNLDGPRTFVALTHFEFDFLAFAQGAIALTFNGRVMHEDIAFGGLDEPEALAVVVSFPKAARERRSADAADVFLTPTSYGFPDSLAVTGMLVHIIPHMLRYGAIAGSAAA